MWASPKRQNEGRLKQGTTVPALGAPPSKRRYDIQGLRAILMAQVLLYHAWRIGSPIGVDSFIMISAYLMTSSFLRRTEAGKMPFFIERWGNTFKRLLPPLVIVVLATLGASLLILTADRWREITVQSFASITYWENWRLAAVSADYYADDHALSSPLQHLWSMSMQGQMFLLWPLLMTICVVIARKIRVSPRGLVAITFGLVAAFSLLWLMQFSPDDASVYFDTRSRIWEFALGSMIAALAPWLRLPRKLTRLLVPTAFIVLILYCLVSIGSYPGPMAAVPILAVSVILLYNPDAPTDAVGRVLAWKPLVALGDISYAVYLVHWPVFVFFLAYRDQEQLGLNSGIALIVISVVLGWVLTKLVDDPLRKLPWTNRSTKNKYVMVVLWLIIGLLPVTASWIWLNDRINEETDASVVVHAESDLVGSAESKLEIRLDESIPIAGPGSAEHPGARILLGEAEPDFAGVEPIPDALTAAAQPIYDDPCPPSVIDFIGEGAAPLCSSLGDRDSKGKTVVLAGSSHAQQLLTWQIPPLIQSQDWEVFSVLFPGCPWTMPGNYHQECSDQNQRLFEYVDQNPPDYAFLIVTLTKADSNEEVLVDGVVELVQELLDRGVMVFGISDSIRAENNLFECSSERPENAPYGGCLLLEDEHFADSEILDPLLRLDGFHFLDMRDAYCVDGICPTIIGNVMVYFDGNHVTTAYSRSVAPFFSQRVLDVLNDPFLVYPSGYDPDGEVSICARGRCEVAMNNLRDQLAHPQPIGYLLSDDLD